MHISLRRLLAVGFLAAVLPAGLMAGTASAATAPHTAASVSRAPASHAHVGARLALSGYGLDNTDPAATGCWDSRAYVASSANIYDGSFYLGYVDNWYSPDCGTNWSETFVNGGGNATITVWTVRTSDNYSTSHYTTFYSYAWSNQVYAPNVVACAEGTININNKYIGHSAACA